MRQRTGCGLGREGSGGAASLLMGALQPLQGWSRRQSARSDEGHLSSSSSWSPRDSVPHASRPPSPARPSPSLGSGGLLSSAQAGTAWGSDQPVLSLLGVAPLLLLCGGRLGLRRTGQLRASRPGLTFPHLPDPKLTAFVGRQCSSQDPRWPVPLVGGSSPLPTQPGAIPAWAFLALKVGRSPLTGQEPGMLIQAGVALGTLGSLLATWPLSPCFVAITDGKPRHTACPEPQSWPGQGCCPQSLAPLAMLFLWDKIYCWGAPTVLLGRPSWGRAGSGVPPPWLASCCVRQLGGSARQGLSQAGLLGGGSYLAVHEA